MQARILGLNFINQLIVFHHFMIIWMNEKISSVQGYFTGCITTFTGERNLPGMSTITGPEGLKFPGIWKPSKE